MKEQMEEICWEIDAILAKAGELGRINGGELFIGEKIVFEVHFPLFNHDHLLALLGERFPKTKWNVTESTITARPVAYTLPYTAPTPKGYYHAR